jgi:hypothetical protein
LQKNAVIDKGIEGWATEKKEVLARDYDRVILVGSIEPLSERAGDKEIAAYCKDNYCDLFTPDMRFFRGFFESGVRTVRVTNYDWWNNKYILKMEAE